MFNLQELVNRKRERVWGEGDLMFGGHYFRIPNCHRKSRTGLELERNQRERDVKIVITLDHEVHISDQFIWSEIITHFPSSKDKGISKVHLSLSEGVGPRRRREGREREGRGAKEGIDTSDMSEVTKSRTLPAKTSKVSFWHPH
jgi:hypothetical protein